MKASVVALLFTCITRCLGATPKEYEAFFYSSKGLDMSSADAAALARTESIKLADSGVTVSTLQQLRDVLYSSTSSGLDLAKPEVRKWVLPLAYAHSRPDKLQFLFKTLYSSGDLDLSKVEAQSRAIELSLRQVEPDSLKALYHVIYSRSGLDFSKADAQKTSIEQAAVGADAETFKQVYLLARQKGLPQSSCIAEASREAVKATLQGLVRRHAKDTIPYTAAQFQSYYGDAWFSEWGSGPSEQRVAEDGFEYTAASFAEHYGSSWAAKWASSKVATQVRIAQDGKHYTMKDFADYYKDEWQNLWEKAPETRCQECAPYPSEIRQDVVV